MEQITDRRKAVKPQTVWLTLNEKQQQQVLQTIVFICQQMVIRHQEENNDKFAKHSGQPN